MSSVTTSGNKRASFDGRKMWFLFAAIASVVVAVLVFILMSQVTRTENYYVLNEDIPARTLITPELLEEKTVPAGAVPSNALTQGQLLSEDVFSLYALKANDVLTKSNVGELLPLTQGLPSNFVVASFAAAPNNSAAGNIKRGDYIDIVTIAQEDVAAGEGVVATYVLQRVLVIDATIDLDNYDGGSSSGDSSEEGTTITPSSQTGAIPMLYTVGLTQEHALRLAVATQYDLFVVMSSRDSVGGKVDTTNLTPISSTNIWQEVAPDAGKKTDNTFGLSDKDPVRPGKGDDTDEPSKPTTKPSDEPSTPDNTGEPSTPGTEETPAPETEDTPPPAP